MDTPEIKKIILQKLQTGINIEQKPFTALAKECEISGKEVAKIINELKESGEIRRFGAVFDSHALGYSSTLCAAQIDVDDEQEIARITDLFKLDSRITHAYIRKGTPNLWFTITELEEKFAETLKFYHDLFADGIWNMPATKRYKIRAVFDGNKTDVGSTQVVERITVTEEQKKVIRYFQGDICVAENLFEKCAEILQLDYDLLMSWLKEWQNKKVMRRLSAIVRHRRIGVNGNAMCAWEVAKDRVDEVGEYLSTLSSVSHCYEREVPKTFKFNMFAMMHGKTLEEVTEQFTNISIANDLPNGKMFDSIKEIEKSSPKYFI